MHEKLKYFLIIMIPVVIFSCAKPGSPSGGPKDKTPPKVVEMEPENGSVNFEGDAINIHFNEFIQLNNIKQNLIVSPPFSEKPEVKLKGKKIKIELPEEPKKNTTYSFTFLNAISDITERNEVSSFVYAFSTGPIIDSLKISGEVEDAFTTKKSEDVFVMLYKNHEDSVFRKQEPDYLTKTDKQGKFAFSYIAAGKYKIYALDDANYSYTFDQPNEKIAFIDSLIVPGVELIKDSTDSVKAYSFFPDKLKLRMFEEEQKQQYIESSERPLSDHLKVIFKKKQDSVFNWYSDDLDTSDVFTNFSQNLDTLNFRIKDTSLCKQDSLSLIIRYYSCVDSIGWLTDTLVFSGKSKYEEEKIQIEGNLMSRSFQYWENAKLKVKSGIKMIDTSKIAIFRQINDSTEKRLEYELKQEGLTSYIFKFKIKQGEKYRFSLDSAAVTDIQFRSNDSTGNDFTVSSESDYSNLKISIPGTDDKWLCDILQSDKIVKRKNISENGTVEFVHLKPGKYNIRIIYDKNSNGKWDTGNFDEKTKPEGVYYKQGETELRKNWTQEVKWMMFEEE